MIKLLNEFTGTVRRAVDDYDMIVPGDRIAVGVSGGKDSMLLLAAMNHLKSFYPKPFELEAITIELGFEGMDFEPVAEKASWITPVPGGVGKMTIAMLMDNTVAAAEKAAQKREELRLP